MLSIGKYKSFQNVQFERWNAYQSFVPRRRLASSAAKTPTTLSPGRKRSLVVLSAATVLCGAVSVYVRQWRRQKLDELLDHSSFDQPEQQVRTPADLIETMERTGLMGKPSPMGKRAQSVKEELDSIRQWHTDHGYKGGLVLRELSQPLYVDSPSSGTVEDLEEMALDPMRLARRECYYLYYEITGNGQIRQQIFCRGTTLTIDILTCLSFWMVRDAELGCRVHLGFRNQADRILEDILPLLAPVHDERTTIEVSGHSLGGAVAYIVAAKLRKRGYRVVRVTSVAAPRFCATAAGASKVEALLPEDNIRIENDTDIVPFLPPFGHHVGNKLYLIDESGEKAFVRSDDPVPWVDSVFVNFRPLSLLMSRGNTHRLRHNISLIGEKKPETSLD